MPAKQIDVLADFRVAAPVRSTYVEREGAKRTPALTVSDVAYVTRGAHSKSGVPVLMVVDGSSTVALTLGALASAIAGGTITKAEIDALLTPTG
jgi:hypothetical protein